MALCSTGMELVSEITDALLNPLNVDNGGVYNTWGKDEDLIGDYSVAAVGTRKNGTGVIKLKDIPDKAKVLAAYLIYNTYQANSPVAHPTVYLDGGSGPVDVTPPLPVWAICGSTCWYNPGFEPTTYLRNRVYVSDVTTEVNGNGDYAVTGLPTTPAMRISTDGDRIPGCLCSQGALLFVVWEYPVNEKNKNKLPRGINLYVGAKLLSNNPTFGATPSYNLPFQPVKSTVDMNFFKGNTHIEVAAGDTQASIPGDSFAINQVQFTPPNNAFTKIGSSLSLRKYSVAQIYNGENSAFAKTTNDCICWFFFAVSGDKTQPKSQFQIVNCVATWLRNDVTPEATTISVDSNFTQTSQTVPGPPPAGQCRAVKYTGRFVEPNPPGMFPSASPHYYIKIDREIMKVTAKAGEFINTGIGTPNAAGQLDQLEWTVERAQAGTTAAFHAKPTDPINGDIKTCVYMLAPPRFIRDMQAGLAAMGQPPQRPRFGRV